MKMQKVVVGELSENCYIIDMNNEVLVIDPGDEFDKINKVIANRKVIGILITHNHFDHVGALPYFKNIPVYSFDNLEEKMYTISSFKFEVILTPGHTSDSISFYFVKDNIIFCGDFIFYHSIGRCDLPTGNEEEMRKSIEKIKMFSNNVTLYPGHGRETTIGEEKKNNYYFNEG